jgi:peptidoglycan/LPS O-acetylase OafA/YrhL
MAEPMLDSGAAVPSGGRASGPSTSSDEGPSSREKSLAARAPRVRLRQLDALRGVAILLALGEHRYVSDVWTRVGWTGVDLFFVLSGFLISGLLFNEHTRFGAIRFGRFFMRRGLKIYPGYYVLLAYFF